MQCPNCGFENPPAMRFCGNCGQPLEAAAPSSEERRIVTVLFADIAGFTGLAEALDPEDLRAVVARFYAAMAQEVRRFGGTVEKYVGDAALAIFGLPDVHEDDAERAVRAALAMQQALVRLNEHLMREGGPHLGIRVGINTGEVVADPKGGALGEFHLAADALNVAARLQTHGEAGQILLGPRTERLVRGVFELTPMGEITLKGKGQPVAAWQVVGLRAERAQRGLPGRQAPLIGRSDEMDLLLRVYDKVVRDRRPHLATLLGVPGVGKSRLQNEFTTLLAALPDGPVVRKGRCLPYGERAFSAVAEILTSDAGILDGDPPETARGKLTEAVRRVAPDDPDRLAAALGFLIGLAFPASAIAAYDPRAAREEAFRSWRHYLKLRAAAQPLVLVIEDVHWADDGLLDLLDHTATRLADVPVFLLCLTRPELLERRPQWGGGARSAATINLEPLSESESRALISALLDLDDLPETMRQGIVAKSEGNPLFVEEIIRMLIDQGAIAEEGSRWRATAQIASIPIPDTVQGVLAARLDRLPEGEKRLLQYAAVVGRVFWLDPLRTLVGHDDVEAGVEALEQRELVRERDASTLAGDREFIFKHVLTREVAYGSLPRAVRSRAHATVARWLEQMTGARADEIVDVLAYHWSSAGDAPRAVEFLIRAGERARTVFNSRRAAEAFTEALRLGQGFLPAAEVARVRRRRGEAYQLTGDYDAARADFEAVLQSADAMGDQHAVPRLLYELTRLHHRQRTRTITEIIAGFEEARRLAVEIGDRHTEGLCLTEIATAHWDEGRVDLAGRLALEALEILRETGDHSAIAGAMNFLSMARYMLLDAKGGLEWANRALEEARTGGDRAREATALSYVGNFLIFVGRVQEAFEVLDQAQRVAEEIADRRRLMWVAAFRGIADLSLGRYERAIADNGTAAELARSLGVKNQLFPGLLAISHLLIGDLDIAGRVADELAQHSVPHDSDGALVFALRGLVRLERGEPGPARRDLDLAGEILRQYPRADALMFGGSWLSLAWLFLGEYERAAAAAAMVTTLLPADAIMESVATANAVAAEVARHAGRLDEAAQRLRAADQALGGQEFPLAIVEVELARARLLFEQGRPSDAEEALRRAEAAVGGIRDQIENPTWRASFERSFVSRRVREVRASLAGARDA